MADADRSETAPEEKVWRALAERAIGANLDTLRSRSADGLTIAPLYPRAAADPCQPWRAQSAWSVAQRVDHPDAEAANGLALLDLEGGADALVLVGAASPYARGFGGSFEGGTVDLVLASVELDFISLRIDAGPATAESLAGLARLVAARRLASAALVVDVGFDPIGWGARRGATVADDPSPVLDMRAKAGLAGAAFLADGRPWHEAGAGEAQELAAILATAVAYIRRQEALGIPLDAAFGNVALLLAADAEVFLGLAKFRAIRRLWARLQAACSVPPMPVRLHAETSWRTMTRRDPWTNVMRATAATFAAGLGGADAIGVLPFTLPLGLPDAGARRLARNVQRVLLDEAHLAQVEDPAAGAGGFETLTTDLCARAWTLFQDIEREGGIERAIAGDSLKRAIAGTARDRAGGIANLTRGIIGTNRFANLDAPSVEVLDIAPRPKPDTALDALPVTRDAAPFEGLRDRADRLPARPRIFLATLGPPADFGPRATYAANVFAAGGLRATAGVELQDLTALIAAFAASGGALACLCGTDVAYQAEAEAAVTALRGAGACRVLMVGRPGPAEAAWRAVGVDGFVHEGCDALRLLGDTLDLVARRD